MKIKSEVLAKLKKPLGKTYVDLKKVKRILNGKKIISVGDITTLSLLAIGIKPHLAVFDFAFMRKPLLSPLKAVLLMRYPRPKRETNKKGHLSENLLKNAEGYIREGGGVLIEGEEDLTALAFILKMKKNDIVVYGQPKKGMVVVEHRERIIKKIEKWLASPFSHKVKRDKRKE